MTTDNNPAPRAGQRLDELTDLAIDALMEGADPLAPGFLSQHNVTLNECFDLADSMAAGLTLLRVLKQADPDVLLGAVNGAQHVLVYKKLVAALEAWQPKQREVGA